MCGIGGGISLNNLLLNTPEQWQAFANPMQYRGPDSEGIQVRLDAKPQVAFAHRRLSIIDLSDMGHQPMESTTGRSMVVLNGEIYNYEVLKSQLPDYPFRSTSDTEVLLAGYETWGFEELLHRLRGMFAMALYDFDLQQLFLARDPFGKKPLYYYSTGDSLYFSSDIRSFRVLGTSQTLDLYSLGYYFQELSTPRLHTIWKEIKKLPEGHWATFSQEGFKTDCYWNLEFNPNNTLSLEEILERTDELLTQSVKRRLVADVPIGALLSGGIDSSLVVAKMAKLSSSPINTYSVGFEEASHNELPYAKLVAEKYDTIHEEIIVSYKDLHNAHDLILEFGEPFADSSMIPTYLVTKAVAKNHKVVMGGDGGDELYAGYYAHFIVDKVQKYGWVKGLKSPINFLNRYTQNYHINLLKLIANAASGPPHKLINRAMGISPIWLQRMLPETNSLATVMDEEHRRVWDINGKNHSHLLSGVMQSTLHTRLVNDYLVKVDRASMYNSIEMRSPFLDIDLATFASSIPESRLMNPHGPKSILRELAKKYLPHSLINRSKQGFGIPGGAWLKNELNTMWKEVVLGGKQDLLPLDYSQVEAYLKEHQDTTVDHMHGLWALYVFHVWAQNQ